MKITESDVHVKTWGSELWICNNELYCSKILNVEQDKWCSFHCHYLKDETFYILKGKVLLEVGTVSEPTRRDLIVLNEGQSYRVFPGIYHRFIGLCEQNQILETSTQHREDDSYRLDKSYEAT